MSRAGGCDVEQVPGLVVDRKSGRIALHDDHIVELEAFDLPDIRHIDAWPEGKILIGDPTKVRHLAVPRALIIDVRLLRVAGNDGDRRQWFRADEAPERLREKADGLPASAELKELDRRTVASGF